VSVAVQAVLGVQTERADSAAQADSSQAVRWAQQAVRWAQQAVLESGLE
jgi:hypothetical protein